MATLRDVAREADVSVSTVSRVFNEPDKVKDDTRIRVQHAVEALDYRPSRVARRLRLENGLAHMLGLVLPDIQNPFFADVARGVEDVAQENGYTVIVNNSDEDLARQKLCLETLRTESVDGVIVPPVREVDSDIEALVASGIPVVCVDRRMKTIAYDTIVSDNVQGAYEAVSHLIAHGHRRIGLIGGIPWLSTSKERRGGYELALAEHGIELNAALIHEGDSRQESGRSMAEQLLNLDDPPTAIFSGNNLMTLGALEAIHLRGRRIPEDISIVAYDDVPWALALNPPLTAVRQPGHEMGRRAAEMLLQRISEPNRSPTLVTLQPKLIVRKSVARVAGRR